MADVDKEDYIVSSFRFQVSGYEDIGITGVAEGC